MKICRLIFAAVLLMPTAAMAQGGASNGTTGKPASINAVQVGGRDPSSNLQALKVDANGALITSSGASGASSDQVQGNVASGSIDAGNPLKVGGVYNSTLPTLTNGQRGDGQVGTRGSLNVTLMAQDSTTAISGVEDNVDAVATVSSLSRLPTAARGYVYNGTSWDRAAGTTAGAYSQGNAASGATDSGNPVKIGGVYNSTTPTLTTGQRGDLQIDAKASLRVGIYGENGAVSLGITNAALADGKSNSVGLGYSLLSSYGMVYNGSTWDRLRGDANGTVVQPALSSTFWKYAAASGGIANTTTAVTVKAAAGASVRNYVMSMQCSHDTLGAVTELAIRDGAAGTVIWRGKLNTTAVDGSGTTINFDPPLQGTANTLTEIVTLTAVTGGVYCNLQGYTGV